MYIIMKNNFVGNNVFFQKYKHHHYQIHEQ